MFYYYIDIIRLLILHRDHAFNNIVVVGGGVCRCRYL